MEGTNSGAAPGRSGNVKSLRRGNVLKSRAGLESEARRLHQAGQYRRAIECYREMLRLRPRDPGVLSNLGSAYRSLKQPELAVNCHRRALELENDDSYRFNLANSLKDLHCYEEAVSIYRQLLTGDPGNYHYRLNLAIALRDSADHREALQILQSLHKERPADEAIRWEMAQNYLRLGDYANGWAHFESRWRIGQISLPGHPTARLWSGEPLENRKILVTAEQGYGDTLLMSRYIPRLQRDSSGVTLACKPSLHDLFVASGIDCEQDTGSVPDADYIVPIMSLPGILDPACRRLPRPIKFKADANKLRHFTGVLAPSSHRPNVGIVWSGSVTFRNNHNRALSLTQLLSLLAPFDLQLYSFQKGEPAEELTETAGGAIVDAGRQCNSFADTAAALQLMDFIVMTDSSVAHLAASMGKPVINLLDWNSYWLYKAEGNSTPWYPSMRLVRQKLPGSWDSVRSDLFEAIGELVDQQKPGV